MLSELDRLGQLVRALRQARNLTQSQLARVTGTNRSVVAHLEQGLRLPPLAVLRTMSEFLGVPPPFADFFLGDELRLPARHYRLPRYVAVAGLMGSGKTTLARGIARQLGHRYMPESAPAAQYLADLAGDPGRWAFETQLSFFVHKAVAIFQSTANLQPIVVDRSLSEDVHVFARFFHETGAIGPRSFATYDALAQYFFTELPPPDLVLFCRASIARCLERVKTRGGNNPLHTRSHVEQIAKLYEDWLHSYRDSAVYVLDSEKIDWRSEAEVGAIIQDIVNLSNVSSGVVQLDMFAAAKPEGGPPPLGRLEPLNVKPWRSTATILPGGRATRIPISPFAYVAAPFTGKAAEASPDRSGLFVEQKPHGIITRGSYKKTLLEIEAALKDAGISALLPHRDVNDWGRKVLQPQEVVAACLEHVHACDVFVGILSESFGSHLECGVALGCGKPCLLIHCAELKDSFFASGFRDDGERLLVLNCEKLRDLPRMLRSPEVQERLRHWANLATLLPERSDE